VAKDGSMLWRSKGDRNLNRWISEFERRSAQIVIDSEENNACLSVIFAICLYYFYGRIVFLLYLLGLITLF